MSIEIPQATRRQAPLPVPLVVSWRERAVGPRGLPGWPQ